MNPPLTPESPLFLAAFVAMCGLLAFGVLYHSIVHDDREPPF